MHFLHPSLPESDTTQLSFCAELPKFGADGLPGMRCKSVHGLQEAPELGYELLSTKVSQDRV